jgi:hypothetical protein
MGLLTVSDLTGLGEVNECGDQPALGPGEKSMCCPGIGWVIYDQSESEYALCERARAQAVGSGSGVDTTGMSPLEKVRVKDEELAARRAEIEERRAALEEATFQRELQLLPLRAALQARTREEQAKLAAQQAKRRAREELERKERLQKYALLGAAAFAAYKLFK